MWGYRSWLLFYLKRMSVLRVSIILSLLFILNDGFGQDRKIAKKRVIQFAGVVFGSDSSTVVVGAHIYIPKSGRGTTTNPYGFFSFPVLEGDSVVFSAVGYKKSYYIIPKYDKESSLTLIVTLKEDVTFLEEVEIRPFPTETLFKQALVKMEVPERKEYANIYQWLNQGYMSSAYQNLSSSTQSNYRYLVQQQQMGYTNRYQMQQSNFTNPFAWIRFIKSLKKKRKR